MSRHTTTRLPFVTLNGRGVHEIRIDRRHALNHRRVEGLLYTACAPVKSKTLSAAGQAPRPGHQRVVMGVRNRDTDYKLVPSNRPSKQCKRVPANA